MNNDVLNCMDLVASDYFKVTQSLMERYFEGQERVIGLFNDMDKEKKEHLITHILNLNSEIVKEAFHTQRSAAEQIFSHGKGQISTKGLESKLSQLYYKESNIVISNANYNTEKEIYQCNLAVDETHPYFFDHELDHVPGLLMIEGIFQIAYASIIHKFGSEVMEHLYIKKFRSGFKKFCEHDLPTTIEIKIIQKEDIIVKAEVIQNNESISIAKITLSSYDIVNCHESKYLQVERTRNQEWVHKKNQENIIVSELHIDFEENIAASIAFPCSQGHILYDGNPKISSALFILESAKQFLTQVTHGLQTSLDIHQVLLQVEMSLEGPVCKNMPLNLVYQNQPMVPIVDSDVSKKTAEIFADKTYIGQCLFRAKSLNQENYRLLRKK